MRIAYLIRLDTSKESGVLKKILSQSKKWIEHGNHVKCIFVTPNNNNLPIIEKSLGNNFQIIHKPSKLSAHFFNNREIYNAVIEFKPDIIYHRFTKYFPWLRKIIKNNYIILEINSYDLGEFKKNSSFKEHIKYAYHKISRKFVLGNSDGMVAVSNELKDMYSIYGKPIQVVSNGIDLTDFEPIPSPNNKKPNLLFIGSPNQCWHGLDKIEHVATAFPEWSFDIVGITEQQYGGNNNSNMYFHGYLCKMEYCKLMNTADCAIGTLALHRINIKEVSPLKLREYLAYGIPTIIGYKDPDFPYTVPFILELPCEENNVKDNLERIFEFVTASKGKRVPRNEIKHIDSDIKERQRLAFFESIIKKS